MKKNEIAVVGVVYPGVEKYINDYIWSLEDQTFKEFDLIILNDGLITSNSFFKNSSLNLKLFNTNGSPSQIRFNLIKKVIDLGYENVIFSDCDDFFSINRIEISVENLKKYDVVINDLDVISERNNIKERLYLSNRFENKTLININDIFFSNMMGFTNTAARSNILKRILPNLKKESDTYDWYLWSNVLSEGCKTVFTNETSTSYRVYSENIAGLPQKISPAEISRQLLIKIAHYKSLINLDVEYKKIYNQLLDIEKKSKDKKWFKGYVSNLKAGQAKNPLWWENVKIL